MWDHSPVGERLGLLLSTQVEGSSEQGAKSEAKRYPEADSSKSRVGERQTPKDLA